MPLDRNGKQGRDIELQSCPDDLHTGGKQAFLAVPLLVPVVGGGANDVGAVLASHFSALHTSRQRCTNKLPAVSIEDQRE